MRSKVMNERWMGRLLVCDVVLEDLAVLGVTASGSAYGESITTWFNPAVPQDAKDEIEKAVHVAYHRAIGSRSSARLAR